MLRHAAKRCKAQYGSFLEKRQKFVASVEEKKIFTAPLGHVESDEEEKELEHLILGDEAHLIGNLDDEYEIQKASEVDSEHVEGHDSSSYDTKALKPVWGDEEDETELVDDRLKDFSNVEGEEADKPKKKYSEHLRSQFEKVHETPKWAQLNHKSKKTSEEDEESNILARAGDWIGKSNQLPSTTIDIGKCSTLNAEDVARGYIKSIEFHKTSQVALVAAKSGKVTIFQVDGKDNPKIQSVFFKDFPIKTAHFSVTSDEIIVGSQQVSYFYSYDMMGGKILKFPGDGSLKQEATHFDISPDGNFMVVQGKFGKMHLITIKNKECIDSLKMNGKVRAVAFTPDGSTVYSHGDGGQVYIWDMKNRVCTHKFVDEGCVQGTALAVSPNYQYLATGSDSGVVNVYEMSELSKTRTPKPLKTFMNLTTSIDALRFNSTSEILFFLSNQKENAFRMAHFPNMRVFPNFPGSQFHLRMPESFDVSPGSAYFSVGNNSGTASLFRLQHYSHY